MDRRSFLIGAVSVGAVGIAAPSIVRASSLMPIGTTIPPPPPPEFWNGASADEIRADLKSLIELLGRNSPVLSARGPLTMVVPDAFYHDAFAAATEPMAFNVIRGSRLDRRRDAAVKRRKA